MERPPKRQKAGLAGAAQPLNQGEFGTCVAHAFAVSLRTGLQVKYGVACDPKTIVAKVQALCPCWDGHQTDRMPKEWNEKHAQPCASIEDMDQMRRYNVKVQFRKIDDFAEARREMRRAEALKMYMPCTVTIKRDGRHFWHSVARV